MPHRGGNIIPGLPGKLQTGVEGYVTERYAHLLDEHLIRAREALSIGLPVETQGELVVFDGGKASKA